MYYLGEFLGSIHLDVLLTPLVYHALRLSSMGDLTVKTSRRAFFPLVILTILAACTQMDVISTLPLRPPRPNISMTSTDRSPLPQAMGLAEPAGDSMVVRRIEVNQTAKALLVFGGYALTTWFRNNYGDHLAEVFPACE